MRLILNNQAFPIKVRPAAYYQADHANLVFKAYGTGSKYAELELDQRDMENLIMVLRTMLVSLAKRKNPEKEATP